MTHIPSSAASVIYVVCASACMFVFLMLLLSDQPTAALAGTVAFSISLFAILEAIYNG